MTKSKSAPGGGGGKVADMFKCDMPEFLLGNKNHAGGQGLGPSAMFSNLDISDPANGLDPLERRLYHSRAPAKPASSHPADPPRSSPAKPAPPKARVPPPFVNPLPYPAEDACSVASSWKLEFSKDAPPGLLSLGLIGNDITQANENRAGVCVLREMKLPALKAFEETDVAARLRYVTKALAKTEAADRRAKAAWDRKEKTPSEAGSARGQGAEVVPRHQRKNGGRPSLCRPLPDDVIKDPERRRRRYCLNEDSSFASEHRQNFWWKGNPQWQKKTLKDHVRPYDNWTLFRDNAVSLKGCLRAPINTY